MAVGRVSLRAALLLCIAGWPAADCAADDGESQSGPRIEVTEPRAESIVGGKFRVAGPVVRSPGRAETPIVRVNGTDVPVVDGTWSLEVAPPKEGLFRIRVVSAYPGEPASVVEVPVKVDRTAPIIEFSEPVSEVGVHPDGEGRVAGVVTDPNLVRVTINGHDVKVTRQGEFEETFLLPASGETRVEVRALDGAGNESAAVRRLRTTPDPSAPATAPPPIGTQPQPPPAPPSRPPPSPPQEALNPVREAVRWLVAHRSPDGGWECEGFRRWCDGRQTEGSGPDGAGKSMYDIGVTGLALLALLGASKEALGDDAPVVRRAADAGLAFLRKYQDTEGCFGARETSHYVYNHAIAANAMVAAYGTSGNPVQRVSAQKALDFIAIARTPGFAWRYGVKPGDNDTSVTGWMLTALAAARRVNAADLKAQRDPSFVLDEPSFTGIKIWIDQVTDDRGRAGYQTRGTGPARMTDLVDKFPAEKSESMTAICVLARLLLSSDAAASSAVSKGAELCTSRPPVWNRADGSIDFYYWYYATLALNRLGGASRDIWNRALVAAVVPRQRTDGDTCDYRGSWDPLDPWAEDGGRVYSTAILALALEALGRDVGWTSASPETGGSSPDSAELRVRVSRLFIAREGLIDTCGECGGTGKRAKRVPGGYDNVDCKACGGKGRVLDRTRFTTAFWSLKSPAWRELPESKSTFDRQMAECAADPMKAFPIRRHAIKSINLVGDRHAVATALEDGITPRETRWIWYGATGKSPGGWYLYDETADGPWPQ